MRKPIRAWCAADLLGQAEHGPTSPAVLVTTSEKHRRELSTKAVMEWLKELEPTAEVAGRAWRDQGALIVVADDEVSWCAWRTEIATEHLEIQTQDPDWFLEATAQLRTAFVGAGATVAFGQGIGTNHVLPTEPGGTLHGRALGGEVPQDGHLSAGGRAMRRVP